MKNIVIGGAWPYANSSIHIGHLAALLPGDFLARYHKKLGNNVMYISGTDCHGTPITIRARKENKEPKEIAEYYHKEFVEAFNAMEFEYTLYTKTYNEYHYEKVKEIFKKIYDNGYIEEKEEMQPYCPKCNKFLADRELLFVCPDCGRTAKGDGCDCGHIPTEEDLKEATCQECGSKVIEKENKNLYLMLTKLQPKLEEYFEENNKYWRKNARNETLKYLKMGLIDRAITRDLTWGIDVPIKGYENKKLYVWIDAVLGYITATMKYCEDNGLDWKDYLKNDNSVVYMVHGKDNITFHTIILPALLIALEDGINLPKKIVSCEYINVEGEKISKSKGNGITILDISKQFDVEGLRYFFIKNGPENKDGDFSVEEFKNTFNTDLVNKYGNFINRTLKFKGLDKVTVSKIDPEIDKAINDTYTNVYEYMDNLEFKKAVDEIVGLAEFGNKYYDEMKPWVLFKEDKAKFDEVIYNCTNIIANLVNLFDPIMPKVSNKLKEVLNIDISKLEKITVQNDIELKDIEPIFERIK